MNNQTVTKKLIKDKAWRELLSVMDKIHKMNEGVNEEEVTQDVLKAIAELREEECEGFPIVKPIKCDGIPASELLIKDRR
jgi:hypothetical protein